MRKFIVRSVPLLLAFAACTAAPGPVPDAAPDAGSHERARRARYDREIFVAVLAGLYRDGVGNDAVDAITAIDPATHYPANFVYACPVCMPAFDAFRAYRARPGFYGDKGGRDTFGPGLDAAAAQELASADPLARQAAITRLVQGWMAARMDELRLSAAERAEWDEEMELRRKRGMEYLASYRDQGLGGTYALMKTCPLCEAASGACAAR